MPEAQGVMTIDIDSFMRFVMFVMAVSSPLLSWFIANGKATAAEIAEARKHAEDLSAKSCARIDAIEKRLTNKDLRISKLEQDIQHMPNKDAIHRIELNLQKLQGEVEQAMSQWKGINNAIQRLEEYLVHTAAHTAAAPEKSARRRRP